ncbi:glucose dehydrogenase [FAD, quinone] [Nilaparvata lugens]|uniref:glucose dehydrogenase [FAD, quinone] n=1 Tax=Nilaparvata lugens TaxID=108931 RepID=UPI00193DDAC2|nr:glucose dehydrogenase [FAD, quinone] [Nilaparvata lugens]XP_039281978.1 glucose dehydrogenase [FAD, quinone] [Nilaparvata lugens]XP_039281979.1 glucose dehydrogenase [FAD, quinone] [Nilaparvata lugens]
MQLSLRLAVCACLLVAGTSEPTTLLEAVVRFYKKLGLQYREDRFLGNKPILNEYDFIVVGAGPAGSAITNRLTEVPFWNVLLLEAGADDNFYTDIPLLSTYLWFSEYNWNYKTEPTRNACLGLKDQICPWPAGKGVGGGTIINAMIYTRGNKRDYDGWAAMGNDGWSYDEVLPYFKKSEHVTIPELLTSPYHGKQGPLNVEYPRFSTPLLGAFLEAGRELGYKWNDYNNPFSHIGFSKIQATVKDGKRVSASTAFLKPIRKRKNFHISQKSQVTRILIDPETKTAFGVEFFKKGRKRVVLARKEVIISAGAFNSPQLLMLSGIGHKSHLESLGIPVLQDLPVGDNLQEHLAMAGLAFLVNSTSATIARRIMSKLPYHLAQYLKSGDGPFTTLGCEGLGYVRTKYANLTGEDYPDIEYIFVPIGLNSDGGSSLRKTMGVTDYLYDSVYSEINHKDAWSIWPMQLYPYSRGTVRLGSRDPFRQPVITGGFLDDRRDLDTIVEGLKLVVELSETSAFKRFGSQLHRKPLPQCADLGFGSDEYWACSVRHITTQLHHQCGTCKMGPPGDPTAVVNPRLQVYGINNLRVADTSIMPTVPGAHTQAGAYMVGEKAADYVKETWLSQFPGKIY